MHLCCVSSDYLPNIGGIAAHVDGITGGFQAAQKNPWVIVSSICRNPRKSFRVLENRTGVKVMRLRQWHFSQTHFLDYWAKKIVFHINITSGVKKWDVVNWHTPFADAIVAKNTNARLRVFTNHTSQFLEWVGQSSQHPLAQKAIAFADLVLCPSTELVDATIAAGVPKERVHFITNGVNIKKFSPHINGMTIRTKWAIPETAFVFICARRFEKKNGVPYWLKAIPLVLKSLVASKDVRFLLVGDYHGDEKYSDRSTVVRLISELNLGERLIWAGSVSANEMPDYIAASDAAVLPSLIEATSIAGIEAMACGKPLIGTDVGGIPQIISHDKTGLLVPAHSSEALAAAMIGLINDEARARDMGIAARKIVEKKYDWNLIADSTIEIFKEYLNSK